MKEELAIAPFAFLGIKKASQRQGYSRRYQLFEVIVSPNPFISWEVKNVSIRSHRERSNVPLFESTIFRRRQHR